MAGTGGSSGPVRDPDRPWVPASSGWSSPVSSGRRALPGQTRLLQTGFARSPRLRAAPQDPAGAFPPPVLLRMAPKAAASRPRSKSEPFSVTAGGLGQGLMKPELGGSQRQTSICLRAFPTVHHQQEHHTPPRGPGPLPPRAVSSTGAWTPHRLNPPPANTTPCSERPFPPQAVPGPLPASPCLCRRRGAELQRWGETRVLNWVWGRLPGTDRGGGRVCSAPSPGGKRKSVSGAMQGALCKPQGLRCSLPTASSAIPAPGDRPGVGTGTDWAPWGHRGGDSEGAATCGVRTEIKIKGQTVPRQGRREAGAAGEARR